MARHAPNSATGGPPPSDVSTGVGLAGLAGLFVWLVICRNWGVIAQLLDMPPWVPRAPMSGPAASVVALLFSGVPMVLWSVVVDKVHRRVSTGIAWDQPRAISAIWNISLTKLAGLWATWLLIGSIYCIARWYWAPPYLFAMQVLGTAALPLLVLSIPYVFWLDRVLAQPRDGAWHFGAWLIGREACDRDEILKHLRSWAVKGFFTAFMISILPGGFAQIVTMDLHQLGREPGNTCAWLTEAMFLVDVQIAMVGYLLTLKPLDAQIRSANPHLAGWVAALICYPPFVLMSAGSPLDYHPFTADWAFWLKGQTAVMWVWAAMLTGLTGVYAWATVAFGLRFSNLTYRGVLTHGPYRLTRHPAYVAKNLFWWLSTLPFLVTSHSWVDTVRDTVVMALVSGVYYWRAKTEERHLCEEDAKYRAYSAWMEAHAPITRALRWMLCGKAPELQPAE
jgi:protein-S-isoprenylcysteine O-methyltransferase Ste14